MSNINVQVAEVNDAFFNPRLADNPCVSRYNIGGSLPSRLSN